jgi:excisionase family DNA binding protein
MLTALILIVLAGIALVLVLLGVIVVSIQQELSDTELSGVVPSPIPVMVRRLLRLYVRRPTRTAVSTDRQEQCSPATRTTTTQRRSSGRLEPLQAYTVEQVAKMLHIGRDKVYYLLRTGQLRSLKIGKLRRITEQQLAEFIASLDNTRVS